MLKAGAAGYLTKEADAEEVVSAVRAVAAGEAVLSQDALLALLQHQALSDVSGVRRDTRPLDQLTARELEVLRLAARGMCNRDIGKLLNISQRTVGSHLEQVFSKFHVGSRTEAVSHALKTGILDIKDLGSDEWS